MEDTFLGRIKDTIRAVFTDDRSDKEKAIRSVIMGRIRTRMLTGLVILVALSLCYFAAHGNFIAIYYRTGDPDFKAEDTEVTFEKSGIVEVVGVSVKNTVLRVDIGPVSKGATEVTIKVGEAWFTEQIDNTGILVYRPSQMSFPCWQMTIVAGFLFCLWSCFVIFREYRRLKGTELFSYTSIFLQGLSVFFLVVCTGVGIILLFLIRDPTAYNFFKIISWTQTVMLYFTVMTAPGIIIFSAALCISNIQLIRKEGFRFVNLLGIILSFLLVAGMLGGMIMMELTDFVVPFRVGMYMVNVYYGIFSYMVCLLIGVFLIFFRISRHSPMYDKGYIVILGCAIRSDGTLYPLIRGRVDRALAFAEEQVAAGGPEPVFIPSGGKGDDEPLSEAEAMANYLYSKGIPEDRVFPETRSVNTKENMRFSNEIAQRVCPGTSGAFSTTNYHVFRSGVIASGQELDLDGMGARTKWYFWPNALIREFIGLIVDDLKEVILVSGIIVLACTAIFIVIR